MDRKARAAGEVGIWSESNSSITEDDDHLTLTPPPQTRRKLVLVFCFGIQLPIHSHEGCSTSFYQGQTLLGYSKLFFLEVDAFQYKS